MVKERVIRVTGPSSGVRNHLLWIGVAGAVGSIAFVVAQRLEGSSMHIANFMGAQIVQRGGYSASLAGPIGWGVHVGVALSYAALFGLLILVPFFPKLKAPRWGVAALLAIALGWIATLITGPAITTTISLLAGQGFPNALPALNATFGAAFWNHILFFGIALLFTVVVPDLLQKQPAGS